MASADIEEIALIDPDLIREEFPAVDKAVKLKRAKQNMQAGYSMQVSLCLFADYS